MLIVDCRDPSKTNRVREMAELRMIKEDNIIHGPSNDNWQRCGLFWAAALQASCPGPSVGPVSYLSIAYGPHDCTAGRYFYGGRRTAGRRRTAGSAVDLEAWAAYTSNNTPAWMHPHNLADRSLPDHKQL